MTQLSLLLYFLRGKRGKRKQRAFSIHPNKTEHNCSNVFPECLPDPASGIFVPILFNSSSITLFLCPDMVGIVAKLSDCITFASHGENIHRVDVFVPDKNEFIFDPARWPQAMMDNDFLTLSKFFNAEKSIVRVPDLDPRIAGFR